MGSELLPAQPLSRGKRWLFCGLTLLFSIGVLELVSFFLWMIYPPVNLDVLAMLQSEVAAVGTKHTDGLEVLHPYVGWVFNPDAADLPADLAAVNSLGFADTGSSIRRRLPDRIVIGIFGGSVAQQLATVGEQAFRARLMSSPTLKGRKIEIVRMAMSGYKQPQQAMALNYVLALGAEFDIVVNIDGFNETGLAVGENSKTGVFAAYPRAWHARLQDVVDPRTSSISYRLLQIRATRQARAQWIVQSILSRSWTASLIWASQDKFLAQQKLNLGLELIHHSQQRGFGFARQGPAPMYSNEDEMYAQASELWSNSSLQMHHLCLGREIRYLHFLQPNQYHEGSKRLSPEEINEFYTPDASFALAVKQGYPRLIIAGGGLQKDGVTFHDLTRLFADEMDTIYSDYFCHYNARGTNLLAEVVADRILESLLPR